MTIATHSAILFVQGRTLQSPKSGTSSVARQFEGRTLSHLTGLIEQARNGDKQASQSLYAELYDELKRLARYQISGPQAPLQATSLVHEAFCKLANGAPLSINDRQHFFATASRVMRQVVLDAVRARNTKRRGGHVQHLMLDTFAFNLAGESPDEELLALDAAMSELERVDSELARLVEMRFYAGLELTEISTLIDRSASSLKRDWRRARAFLIEQISGKKQDGQIQPGVANE